MHVLPPSTGELRKKVCPAVSAAVGTLFLNRCVGGCTVIKSGLNDARTRASTIPVGPETNFSISEFAWTDTAHDAGLEKDALYLIRPDGYVGLADERQDVGKLTEYVARFGIHPRSATELA